MITVNWNNSELSSYNNLLQYIYWFDYDGYIISVLLSNWPLRGIWVPEQSFRIERKPGKGIESCDYPGGDCNAMFSKG